MGKTELRTWCRSPPSVWEVRGIREGEDSCRMAGKKVVKVILYARDSPIGEVIEDYAETSEWWKGQLGKTFHFDDVFTFEAGKGGLFGTLHYDLPKLKKILET